MRSTNSPSSTKAEAELVKLRYFVGMTNDEAAERWAFLRALRSIIGRMPGAWLYRAINSRDSPGKLKTRKPASWLPGFEFCSGASADRRHHLILRALPRRRHTYLLFSARQARVIRVFAEQLFDAQEP